MALRPKPGLWQSYFNFRPEISYFDHLYIMLSNSDSFRDENSTYCGLTWHRARVNPRGKEFGNWKYFHAKIDQNFRRNASPKKSMCPHLPPTFDKFSNKYRLKTLQNHKNLIPNFWFWPDMANLNFGLSNYCYWQKCLKRLSFSPLSGQVCIKNFKKC